MLFRTFRYNRVRSVILPGFQIISHPYHRIGLVYNPFAGGLKGGNRARLDTAVRILEESGSRVELFATPGPQCAGELAIRAAEAGCDLIVAAGGDGTINEAVNGIAGSNIVFGVLPSGTANVLANEIGLAGRPDRAARQLLESTPVRISLGYLDRPGYPGRYFVLMAGVGLDARIVYELDLNLKSRLGKLAYWHGGFRQFGRSMPRFTATVHDKDYAASFALITRVRNYGGDFEIARKIKLTDNDFEVVISQKHEWSHFLRFLGAVMMNRLETTEGVAITRATCIRVKPLTGVQAGGAVDERVYIQTDGESVGVLPATIRAVPDALTLLVPKKYLSR
jgi:diacylglycerol kinase (ATP)